MRIVIVGASLAGLRVAEGLRDNGYAGEVVLIGDELHRPYDRPPLSKQVLLGSWTPDRVFFRSDDELRARGIEHVAGAGAVGLNVHGSGASSGVPTGPRTSTTSSSSRRVRGRAVSASATCPGS